MAGVQDTNPDFFFTQPNVSDSSYNNVLTDFEGGERFFLGEMNIEIDSTLAHLHGGSDTDFNDVSANSWSSIDVPVSYARNLFQYQADAIDVNDLNVLDTKFRMYHVNEPLGDISGNALTYYNTKNIIPTESLVYFNAIPFYGNVVVDSSSNEMKVNADFVRHIAKELFGVAVTDIFNNERTVRNALNFTSRSSFNTQVQSLVDFRVDGDYVRWNDVSDNTIANKFPPKLILKQILDNVRSRLYNIDGSNNELLHLYDGSGNAITLQDNEIFDSSGNRLTNDQVLWRKVPLMPNDMLFFKLTINPHDEQAIKESQVVNPRSYRVRLRVVPDNTESVSGVKGWHPLGWDGVDLYGLGETAETVDPVVA